MAMPAAGMAASNTPLNGEKGMLAEGGMHVPFLIAWPGTIPGGQMYDHPVSALDVAATAAALADAQGEARRSRRRESHPASHRRKQSTTARRAVHGAGWRKAPIREGKWKLLRGGEREYLYDLGSRPRGETQPRLAASRDRHAPRAQDSRPGRAN